MALEQRVSDLESKWDFILEALKTLATKDDLKELESRLVTKDDLKGLRDELRAHIGDLQEDVKTIKEHLLLG